MDARTTWNLTLPRTAETAPLRLGGRRPKVMGILNLTPDSFSDGGAYPDPGAAVDHALRLLGEGADLLDLGAESTRPGGGVYGEGAEDLPADEELGRLLPVLRRLRRETGAPLSVDTRKGAVARAALDEGADLVNDVTALSDPELGRAVAAHGCPVVLMHSRGEIRHMQRDIRFDDVVAEVTAELARALERAEALGIDREQTVVDPGIGFGKTAEQNLALVRRLDALASLGRPVLLGASRKSFLGTLTGVPPHERQPESLAAAAWAAHTGTALVRVHDVAETVRFLATWDAIRRAA
jgi:dihydropteroate synthase